MRSPLVHTGTFEELVRNALDESTPVVLEGSDAEEELSLLRRLERINASVVSNLTTCIATAFRGDVSTFSNDLTAAATVKDDVAAAAYVRGFEEGADAERTRSLTSIGYVRHRLTLVLGVIAQLEESDVWHDIHPWLHQDFTIEFTGSAEDY